MTFLRNMRPRIPRKRKTASKGREVIAEPTRRSIFDVVQINLKIAGRTIYVHRLFYIGEHTFEDSTIVDAMEQNYKETNSGYCTEPLSGILLYYQRFFCCIVEASEEILNKHLSLLFEQNNEQIPNVKLLSAVHHIKGRFWNEWTSYCGKPPERVEEIDPESDLENSMRYVSECAEKLFNFGNAFIQAQLKSRTPVDEELEEEKEKIEEPSILNRKSVFAKHRMTLIEKDPYSDFLPELKLLNFLVNCKHLKDLRQYHQYYEYIGETKDYSQKSWPAPIDLIPYDVFDKPYDPISDLPSLEVDKEEEEVVNEEDEFIEVDEQVEE